jgi:tetratricopeptide (TPR) repeat protein
MAQSRDDAGTLRRLGADLARFWRGQAWVRAAGLIGAVFLAYWPCLQGGFVWDDDAWTLNLRGLFEGVSGLGAIWARPTVLQQYYPLTATTFWLDYQLWGFWTTPYHVENVLLHLLSVWLFWKLLKRLEVPGAGLAAAILALHPLMVESVAWITERKNVLSLALFLGAMLAYGRFANDWRQAVNQAPSRQDWRAYLWALALFLAAYLAKATAFAFPAVLLLTCWWKRGRVRWRQDVLPVLPFFAASIGLGLATSWLERTHVGATGPDWDISFAERCLVAGRALWFYAGKLVWPADLCFIYPRWAMDARSLANWLWPVAALATVTLLWLFRRRFGRAPLAAALFFAGTLFPLLGFINGYFMRYSFVCDHWCYLPSLGLIALGAALATRLAERPRLRALAWSVGALVLAALAVLTFHQSPMYGDAETLYRTTLAKNPNADLAQNNLGLLLFQAGKTDEAAERFQRAVEIRPASAHAHNNLANALRLERRRREAAAHYEISLQLEPDNPSTCNNLAMLLATAPDASLRNGARAVELAERARRLTHGENPVVLCTLAAAYAESGRFGEAVTTARRALELASERPNSQLAQVLERQLGLYEAGSPFHEP